MILEHDKAGDSRTKAKICISRNMTLWYYDFDQICNKYDKISIKKQTQKMNQQSNWTLYFEIWFSKAK